MKERDLTQGGIARNIFTFAVPYVLAYFLQILYGLADLFVIGQYDGVAETTAVSNGAQVMYFVTVVLIGLAMGTTVRIGHSIGARDRAWTARIIGNTVTLFSAVAVVVAAVLLLTIDPIIALVGTPTEAMGGARDYLFVCFLGIPFIIAYNVIASIFRGMGDTRSPMYFVAIACVVNILLDYLFIGYFDLGPTGAALGTTLSQGTAVVFALVSILRHREVFDVHAADFRPDGETMRGLLKIGVPIALQDGFVQVSFVAIMIIANGRGVNDAAAVGIVEKLIGLFFIVPSAMLSTVSAISAQNLGAHKGERALQAMKMGVLICGSWGLALSLLFQFVPELPVRIFTSDAEVVSLGGTYLQSYIWDCPLAGIHFCFSGLFTAAGYSLVSFAHNVASILVVRLPLAYSLSTLFPASLFPMGWASPAGSLLSVIICVSVYVWARRRDRFHILSARDAA